LIKFSKLNDMINSYDGLFKTFFNKLTQLADSNTNISIASSIYSHFYLFIFYLIQKLLLKLSISLYIYIFLK
jgi:hypothetical protein